MGEREFFADIRLSIRAISETRIGNELSTDRITIDWCLSRIGMIRIMCFMPLRPWEVIIGMWMTVEGCVGLEWCRAAFGVYTTVPIIRLMWFDGSIDLGAKLRISSSPDSNTVITSELHVREIAV